MPNLNIKPTHKPIRNYYAELKEYERLGEQNEGTVRAAFQGLLQHYCHQSNLTLLCEKTHYTPEKRRITPDGEVVDTFNLPYGYWEAKDTQDDLYTEASKKFAAGYPSKNIVIQSPTHALLYQHGQLQLDLDITEPRNLVRVLQGFFAYQEENIAAWHTAVAEFREKVPELGEELAMLIETERQNNPHFQEAFTRFHKQCQASINPNLSIAAVEEMLIQHLLTERIFRTVFDNPDFTRRNIIAREIETVIDVLTERTLNRSEFLRLLEPFYTAIERTAATITDFSQKQGFLNTVYEQFFQGFSIKVADTHGIVYTPQPIVDFMVKSVEHILRTEFNRSLSDTGVNIIDPFVGTGNFIVRIMQELDPISLERKYTADPPELQCNEVMLLPYYIANLNIEHEFYTATNRYVPYEGLCLVDTFEVAEDRGQLQLFTPDNTARVEKQKESEMFVVIGNPPYNVGQVNENDNNKNREHETMDKRIAETYSQDSKATNKNALSDSYVKAIRWSLDRIGEEGVVAFVTNNSFIGGLAFDGMRKHLAADCDAIYILDLGGNARKGLKVSDANVFGIRVGVSINLFVKKKQESSESRRIFYYPTDELWDRKQKFDFLNEREHTGSIAWQSIQPDARHTWLTEGLHAEFDTFIPMGSKAAKAVKGEAVDAIFKTYSNGVKTNRDAWVNNFNRDALAENMSKMIETYNAQVFQWERQGNRDTDIDDFVVYDDKEISWSRDLKAKLKRGTTAEYVEHKVRTSVYRPFTKSNLYFDRVLNDVVYVFPSIFPTPETEAENQVIWLKVGSEWSMFGLMVNQIPDLLPQGGSQCFPFYIYDEDGTNRRENITDWALEHFRTHYRDDAITKWDIFYYNYGLLHHPDYCEKYEANLKRDLPHIPFAKDFWGFAEAGARLADLHVNYEFQPEYGLKFVQNPDAQLNWRVEKMKLSKDKTSLIYNDFLTLSGIPPKTHDYRLGTRSALEWVIDQYRVKTDKRTEIVNDPNRADDPQYIVKLIGQVITVSLETVDIVENLSTL